MTTDQLRARHSEQNGPGRLPLLALLDLWRPASAHCSMAELSRLLIEALHAVAEKRHRVAQENEARRKVALKPIDDARERRREADSRLHSERKRCEAATNELLIARAQHRRTALWRRDEEELETDQRAVACYARTHTHESQGGAGMQDASSNELRRSTAQELRQEETAAQVEVEARWAALQLTRQGVEQAEADLEAAIGLEARARATQLPNYLPGEWSDLALLMPRLQQAAPPPACSEHQLLESVRERCRANRVECSSHCVEELEARLRMLACDDSWLATTYGERHYAEQLLLENTA